MTSTTFIRFSGLAAIAAGLFTVAGSLLELNLIPSATWIYWISTLATILALIGLHIFQKEEAGALGLVGFLVSLLGNLLLFYPDPMIGGSVFALGLILLGVAILKANTFAKWIPWLWIVSPMIAIFGFVIPAYEAPLFLFGAVASGLAFLGIGRKLWSVDTSLAVS